MITTKLTKQGLIALTVEVTKLALYLGGECPSDLVKLLAEEIEVILNKPVLSATSCT